MVGMTKRGLLVALIAVVALAAVALRSVGYTPLLGLPLR